MVDYKQAATKIGEHLEGHLTNRRTNQSKAIMSGNHRTKKEEDKVAD